MYSQNEISMAVLQLNTEAWPSEFVDLADDLMENDLFMKWVHVLAEKRNTAIDITGSILQVGILIGLILETSRRVKQ